MLERFSPQNLKSHQSSSSSDGDSLFQNAFEHSAIGIALVAPDGRWLMVNRAVCEMIGYSGSELLRLTFQEVTHADDLDLDLANVRKILAGKIDSYQIEKRYLHKNGATVWGLLSVSLVRDSAGAPRYFISQIQNITSRKENERRLDQAAAEIKRLQQSLIKVCAWTKRIEVDGRWITVDEFLRDRLRLNLTHGISIEGARMFRDG